MVLLMTMLPLLPPPPLLPLLLLLLLLLLTPTPSGLPKQPKATLSTRTAIRLLMMMLRLQTKTRECMVEVVV